MNKKSGGHVNSDVKRVISHVIEREIKDPRVTGLISVVKVEVTKDLKECKCYISVLGGDGDKTIEGLQSASGFIRKRVAEALNMRNTPEIRFILDDSIQYGIEMSKKIDDIIGGKTDEG